MDWITDRIAIGNYVDGTDVAAIQEGGFRSILCLDRQIPAPENTALRRKVVHLEDAPVKQLESFVKAVEALEKLTIDASPVLVHCHAGRSRSVVVVAGYLMRATGCSPEEALAEVKRKREISITPGVEQLLYFL